jgi:hypothetical protein
MIYINVYTSSFQKVRMTPTAHPVVLQRDGEPSTCTRLYSPIVLRNIVEIVQAQTVRMQVLLVLIHTFDHLTQTTSLESANFQDENSREKEHNSGKFNIQELRLAT